MDKIKNGYTIEYQTNQIQEVEYLTSVGIRWEFVFTNKYNIRTYKYKKTKELYYQLYKFYSK